MITARLHFLNKRKLGDKMIKEIINMIEVWNLWLLFVIGYGTIWASMILADRKRGKPIEDPEIFEFHGKKSGIIEMTITLSLFLISLFIPIKFGITFLIGLSAFIFGIILNVIAMYSFVCFTGSVNTGGMYRYSRNPMYIGGFFFIFGLNLMGWSISIMNIVFVILSVFWMAGIHWSVLLEESFLEDKYGETYQEYKQKVPRYFFKRT